MSCITNLVQLLTILHLIFLCDIIYDTREFSVILKGREIS